LKRACAESNGDLARRAAPQRTLNRQSSSQDLRTTARSFAALIGNGTIVTRSGPVTCGEPNPVLTSAFGGVVVEGGGESFDAAGSSVVALDAGAMSTVFESVAVDEVSVEVFGEVSGEAGGEVSGEAGGEVSGEAGGEVSGEAGGEVSVEAGGEVTVEAGGDSGGGVGGFVAADWVSATTGGDSVVAVDGYVDEVVGSCETAGGFVAAPEAGAGSSARAVPTNAEAATEAATRASNNPKGLSDRRRRLGIRLLRTTTHLPS
jgi:hypothetical protein